jgi:hypothetical protein
MWKELVHKHCADCQFADPASGAQLTQLQNALSVPLPDELRQLLLESDGVHGVYGVDLVWSAERIRKDNLTFRSNRDFRHQYMPFDHLLFFADAGNGDQFAFTVLAGEVRKPDVFVWNHEDDSRVWVAPSLAKYLEWWLTGRIKV